MIDTTQFLELMKETIEIEGRDLSLDDKFRDMDEWTSLAYLSTIAMIDDEYNVIIGAAEFRQLETLGDIVKAIELHQA